MTFHCFIAGTDRTSIVRSITVNATSGDRVGSAEIRLTFDASAGYTFPSMSEVQVYDLVGGAANGLFGGFVSHVEEEVVKGTSQKFITLGCRDYNVLLDYIMRDAAPASQLTVAAGAFHTQISTLVQAMQRNGDSAVNKAIEATNEVQHLTGATTLPAITVKGESLRQALRKIMNNAQANTSTLRPRFSLQLVSDGAGGVQCTLVVWDGAAPPASIATFKTTPGANGIFDYERFLDSTMPLGNRAQLVWQNGTDTFVYTYASIGTTYTNDYQSHGLTGHRGYWMLPPVKADSTITTAGQAQDKINILGKTREFPRETFTVIYDHAPTSTLFIRPGNTVHITTDNVDADYEVASVAVSFPTINNPSQQRVTLECGLPKLELFEDGTEGISGAPRERDLVPPEPPGLMSVTSNVWNETTGHSDITVQFAPSSSIDARGYALVYTHSGQPQFLDIGDNESGGTVTGTISVQPNQSFTLDNYARDGATPPNWSTTGGQITGTSAAPSYRSLPNGDFENVDPVDSTLPALWTRTTASGASAARDTSAPYSGAAALKMTTGASVGSSGSLTSSPVVAYGYAYNLQFFAKSGTAGTTLNVSYIWLDADAVTVLGTTTVGVSQGTTYARNSLSATPIAGTRHVEIKFNLNTLSRAMFVDSVSLQPQTPNEGIEDGAITGPKFNSLVTLTNQQIDLTSTSKITGGSKLTIDANGISAQGTTGAGAIDFYNDVGTRIGRAYSSGSSGNGSLTLTADYNGAGSTDLTVNSNDTITLSTAQYSELIQMLSTGITFDSGASTRRHKFVQGSVVTSGAALSTSATDGFLYIPTCAGTPTGAATTQSGTIPLVYDTTNSHLYAYVGSTWQRQDIYPALKHLTATATLNFGSTPKATDSDLTITCTGAAVGDVVNLGVPNGSTLAGGSYSAWVSATDTVTVRFSNYSAGALDPASGTFRVAVWQY